MIALLAAMLLQTDTAALPRSQDECKTFVADEMSGGLPASTDDLIYTMDTETHWLAASQGCFALVHMSATYKGSPLVHGDLFFEAGEEGPIGAIQWRSDDLAQCFVRDVTCTSQETFDAAVHEIVGSE